MFIEKEAAAGASGNREIFWQRSSQQEDVLGELVRTTQVVPMVPQQRAKMPLPASFTPIRNVGKQRQHLSHQQECVGESKGPKNKGKEWRREI